jgi:exopolyphosphatase/guanosine-5'-triphosphate,3'-diphosphate pyrophosphatase
VAIQSVRLGAVRLQQWEQQGAKISKKEISNMRQLIQETLEEANLPVAARDTYAIGIGGTVRALLDAKHRGETEFESVLSRADVDELIESLFDLTLTEMEERFGIDKKRAQIIIPGGLIVAGVMELYELEEVHISVRGLRDGVLEDLIASVTGEALTTSSTQEFERIGAKYDFDREHALKVAELSLQLFDQLQELHQLSKSWREPLRAAAMLHDVGQFVSYSKHHKHSYYILLNEDVPGLTPQQQQAAASITRYHRKSVPLPTHEEFGILTEPVQEGVMKCAALLRLADAFDRQHRQLVTALRIRVTGKSVEIEVEARAPVPLELSAAPKKSELFEKVFERKLVFEVVGNGVTRAAE